MTNIVDSQVGFVSHNRIIIDAADADVLMVKLIRRADGTGANDSDNEKVRNFPQRKWSQYLGAWQIPLTDPNIIYLTNNWKPHEYRITDAAAMLLEYHRKTRQVADKHLKARLEFLSEKVSPHIEDYLYATEPYDHQRVAFSSMRRAEFFALLMEMGTGKTKVVIDVIGDRTRQLRKKAPDAQYKTLIVAPKTICLNWIREFEKHSVTDMAVEYMSGAKIDRVDRLLALIRDKEAPSLVAIINYEGVSNLQDVLVQVGFNLMVLDESTRIKNSEAKRSKACYVVGESVGSRAILTGLVIPNNVLDLYGQFHFLKPGCLGYTSRYAYQGQYANTNPWGGVNSWRGDKLLELQERLARFSFVIRRAQCIDLPDKIYEIRDIEMMDRQFEAYTQMATAFVAEMEEAAGSVDAKMATAQIILTQMLRLSQITSGFVKGEDGTMYEFDPNPKLEAVKELLEDLDEVDKVVIWSRFVPDIEMLIRELKQYNPVDIYGKTKADQRMKNNIRFEEDPTCRVIIGHPECGGMGINLVAANHVIYYSNDFNLEYRMQSEDRCHRIGQKRSVIYTDLVVPDTIDVIVLETLKAKKGMADLLIGKSGIIAALRAQLKATV